MKLTLWTIKLSLISNLLPFNWFVAPTFARCVQADVSIQYNISGSRQPTTRTNDIEMSGDESCWGNASITTGVQGNIGGNGKVHQSRVVRHRMRNSQNYSQDYGSSSVRIQSNPAIDVYNPADNLEY